MISNETGVLADVRFQRLRVGEPSAYWAHSIPAPFFPGTGEPAAYHGFAFSTDRARALAKAIGESVERYCATRSGDDGIVYSTAAALRREHRTIAVEWLRLFSSEQYLDPDCPFTEPTDDTPITWALGSSLVTGEPVYVPAVLVFVPYTTLPGEARLAYPISTGLSCGLSAAQAAYRGLLEVIERDTFMLVWRRRMRLPSVELTEPLSDLTEDLLRAARRLPMACAIKVAELDLGVPVVLTMLTSAEDTYPGFAMGAAADLDMEHAVVRSLEEALLCYHGLTRVESPGEELARIGQRNRPMTPERRALLHAHDRSLAAGRQFLVDHSSWVPLRSSAAAPDLPGLVRRLAERGFDPVVVDVTQPDIDDVGLKVVRAVVPGLQPLDVDVRWPYLGGTRVPPGTGPDTGHQVVDEGPVDAFLHPFA